MDWEPVLGVVLGLPALAISVRLVTKPLIDGWVRTRELKAGVRRDPAGDQQRDERVLQLEAEVSSLRQELERLNAVEGFYKELRAPAPGAGGSGQGDAATSRPPAVS